ncbi:hypothetical protein MRX96_059687 [Rhipicephalus microplus]
MSADEWAENWVTAAGEYTGKGLEKNMTIAREPPVFSEASETPEAAAVDEAATVDEIVAVDEDNCTMECVPVAILPAPRCSYEVSS